MADYTCPMHPEVHKTDPGNCPICGMALEPRDVTTDTANPELVNMTRRFWMGVALTFPERSGGGSREDAAHDCQMGHATRYAGTENRTCAGSRHREGDAHCPWWIGEMTAGRKPPFQFTTKSVTKAEASPSG